MYIVKNGQVAIMYNQVAIMYIVKVVHTKDHAMSCSTDTTSFRDAKKLLKSTVQW